MDQKLSKNTRIFGITSFLVDVSTEMLTPIIPLFLLNVLKANTLVIGLIEGVSELIVSVFRAFSGYISDRFGKRKSITTCGYFISSFMKIFFVFSTSWLQVFVIRMIERFGKGIRGVPRDAIIVKSEKKENLGRAFGFRKMMDASGSIIGSILAAIFLMHLIPIIGEENTYRTIFAVAVIPAILGAFIIWKFVKDVNGIDGENGKNVAQKILANKNYRNTVIFGALFGISFFGNAFFILRAHEITGSVFITLLGYIVYAISYTVSAIPVGILMDKLGGKKMLFFAYILFAFTLAGFAFANDLIFMLFFASFGMVMAILETTPRAFVAKIVNSKHYGTTIGFYQGITGILILPANLIAGYLWECNIAGVHGTFVFSFIISISTVILMLLTLKDKPDGVSIPSSLNRACYS